MGNSKVIFGNETLIDLTGDTVTPDTLLAGTTAHNRSGEQIVGTATVPDTLDDLTDVDFTSPAEGDLLQYNGTSGKWENSDEIPQELAAMQEAGAVNHFVLTATSNVNNGITYTVDADAGSVTMNGEASDTSTLILTNIANCEHLAGKNVTVDLQNSIPSVSVGFVRFVARDANNNTVYSSEQIISKSTFLLPPTAAYYLANLYIQTGQTVSNLTIKPMLYDARLVNPPYQQFTMTNRELTDGVTKATYFNETYTNTSPAGTLNVKGHYFTVGKMCFLYLRYDASVDMSSSVAMTIPNIILPKPVNQNDSNGDLVTTVPRDWSGNFSFISIRHLNGILQFYYIPKGRNTISVVYEIA